MAAGSLHACALVPSASPPVECWGGNTFEQASVPQFLPAATYIAAGWKHTCAVTPSTSPPVTCWGDDTEFQLAVPAKLGTPTQLVAANNYTCALVPTAIAARHLLGRDQQPEPDERAPRAGGAGAACGAAGAHVCTVGRQRASGVTCWGNNGNGQLQVPANVVGVTQVRAICIVESH